MAREAVVLRLRRLRGGVARGAHVGGEDVAEGEGAEAVEQRNVQCCKADDRPQPRR